MAVLLLSVLTALAVALAPLVAAVPAVQDTPEVPLVPLVPFAPVTVSVAAHAEPAVVSSNEKKMAVVCADVCFFSDMIISLIFIGGLKRGQTRSFLWLADLFQHQSQIPETCNSRNSLVRVVRVIQIMVTRFLLYRP